jgi:DNA-binding FrmR family transcriptional regulator
MNEASKKEVLSRLKSVEGHIRGIERMVEEDHYCVDIIQQTIAVKRAIDKINGLILDNHLHTCVTTAIQGDSLSDRERVIHELLEVFETTSKI